MGGAVRIRTRGQSRTKSWQGQAALIAAALLILAVGLCLFHGASDESYHHGMAPDLCASVVMVLAATVVLTRPVGNGWLVPVPKRFFFLVSRDLPDQPPEPLLSF